MIKGKFQSGQVYELNEALKRVKLVEHSPEDGSAAYLVDMDKQNQPVGAAELENYDRFIAAGWRLVRTIRI